MYNYKRQNKLQSCQEKMKEFVLLSGFTKCLLLPYKFVMQNIAAIQELKEA